MVFAFCGFKGLALILFKCDLCGFEVKKKGIVKHHLDFVKKGPENFEQLIPQLETDQVTDVCGGCFENIVAKQSELNKVQTEGIFDGVKMFIQELRAK